MECRIFQKFLANIAQNWLCFPTQNCKHSSNASTQKAQSTTTTGSACFAPCEVSLETGKPFSTYKQTKQEFRRQYQPLIIALELPRAQLYERINLRVENMFEEGLLQEAQSLRQRGYQSRDPGLQAIGYKEVIEAASLCPSLLCSEKPKKAELLAKIQQNSRNYAKRQICFLRQIPTHCAFHPENAAEIGQCIARFINPPILTDNPKRKQKPEEKNDENYPVQNSRKPGASRAGTFDDRCCQIV